MNKKLEISVRLKEFAKKKFGGIAGLERALDKTPAYFQNYLNGRSYLGSEILIKLHDLGCDINWLLNGSPAAPEVKEPSASYSADVAIEISEIKERLSKLELQNQKWMNFAAEVLDQYKTDCAGKDETIARLSVQFVTLVAANQSMDKLDCGKDKISKE